MAFDSTLILLNDDPVDSGTDGTGTGSDPTVAPGAEITLPTGLVGGLVGVVLFLRETTGTPPADAATFDASVEISVDGGSTWDTWVSFRRVAGSEVNLMDHSTGSASFRRAQIAHMPRADAGSTVHVRPNTTASATTDWNVFMALCDPGEIRDDWLYDNIAN